MTTVTTAPAAKAYIETLLTAALAPTQVWYPRPNTTHDLAENVYIGDADVQVELKQLGDMGRRGSFQEAYVIDLEVVVYRQGADTLGVEQRWWEIAQAIDTAIQGDYTLGGNVSWAYVQRFHQSTTRDSSDVVGGGNLSVEVIART